MIVTTLPLKSISRFSSHSMASRSRWLVGSSSSSTSGRHQRLRQRHALACCRPRACRWRPRRPGAAVQGLVHPLLPVPAILRLDLALQRVVVAPGRGCIGRCRAITSATPRGPRRIPCLVEQQAPGRRRRCASPAATAACRRRLLQARQDLQQRGLAGAVAPDQADSLAGLERESRRDPAAATWP